jgi:tetratricopeptide (TPR) repeat protein
LHEALGDDWGTADTLAALGRLARHRSECAEARPLYERSLAIRQSLGDRMGIAESLIELRDVAEHVGELEESERLGWECLALCREIGNRRGIAEALHHLACALMVRGRFDEARPMLEEAVEISRSLGTRLFRWMATGILAWCETNLGLYEAARRHNRVAIEGAEAMADDGAIAMPLLAIGELASVDGDYTEAQRTLGESLALFRRDGQREHVGLAHAHLARAALALGEMAQARQHLRQALLAGVQTGTWAPGLIALPGAALLMAQEGQAERAVEIYALASRYGYVGKSRFWEDVAGRHIAAVAANLPSDVAEGARARGRACDLDATVAELLTELEGR